MATTASTKSKTTKTESKSLKNKNQRKADSRIPIKPNGSFPLVPPHCIDIIDRNEDNLFYNPRSLDSFDEERMASLRTRIQIDGLQQPPIVRFVTENEKVISVQLIGGERRLRSILQLIEEDLPVYDNSIPIPKTYRKGNIVVYHRRLGEVKSVSKGLITVELFEEGSDKTFLEAETHEVKHEDLLPTMPASKFFAFLPVKAYYDIPDERCIGIAFSENDDSQPLTIAEEIDLVERLSIKGYKQSEIAEIVLGKKHSSNVTWVSQTGNFRTQLPSEAYDRLIDGRLTRHGAVKFLSYPAHLREKLLQETIKAEEEERLAQEAALQEEREQQEDIADIHSANADEAEANGDAKSANSHHRKANSAQKKISNIEQKENRLQKDAGKLKQSHIDKGAANAGLKPRKAKMLSKQEIENRYLKPLSKMISNGGKCPNTGKQLPLACLSVMHKTIQAILTGESDPTVVIQDHISAMKDCESIAVEEEIDLDLEDDDLDDELEETGLSDADWEEEDYEEEDSFDREAFNTYATDMD